MKVGVLATMAFATLIGFPIASSAGLAPDNDGDGTPDALDKCLIDSRNTGASACDHDTDGYGNVCDPDYDNNYSVNSNDFTMKFLPAFQLPITDPAPWPEGMDQDCNGAVNSNDFTMFFLPKFNNNLGSGGPRPGPSGLGCAGTPLCSP